MSALDRDAARVVLHVVEYNRGDIDWALDALEACVRPALPQGIDRDALGHVLYEAWLHEPSDRRPTTEEWEHLKDAVLALLRPVEGVVLTLEEAALAAAGLNWASLHPSEGAPPTWGSAWKELAARLREARS